MKKLMIIPALLLVAALFITCDTGGDWSKIAFPMIPDGATILYSNGWVIDEPDGIEEPNDEGNLAVTFNTPLDGGSKLVVVYNSSADFGWWSGGGVKVGDADSAGNGPDYQNSVHVQSKGFWVLTFALDSGKKVGYYYITGGGPGGSGWPLANLVAMWIE